MKTIIKRPSFLLDLILRTSVFMVVAATCLRAGGIDLSGQWLFQLDRGDTGIQGKWYKTTLREKIRLPGSLQEQGYGDDVTVNTKWIGGISDRSWFTSPRYARYRRSGRIKVPFWLQPDKHYVGPAWYQKSVTIPETWNGKRITLFLERVHWKSTVWVDEHEMGSRESLSTPHVYDLGRYLTAGVHQITIRVDNRMIVNVGPNSHSVSDHTQTDWNGIVGRIELRVTCSAWIDDVQVYPDLEKSSALVVVSTGNMMEKSVSGKLVFDLEYDGRSLTQKTIECKIDPGLGKHEYRLHIPGKIKPWDEFSPNLYKLKTLLASDIGQNEREVLFGMRYLSTSGTKFVLNGRPVFFRGTLECCIFPLTGYPPQDVASWMRIIRICKAHGLNHIRFHSHCPPEAAFIAADKAGFYFQVECASWANQGASIGDGRPLDKWLYAEAEYILHEYGNHPSFMLLAYGNEPAGRNQKEWLGRFITNFRSRDKRRLYTSGSGWPIIPQNDYNSSPEPRIQRWGEGLKSRINSRPPETVTDYSDFVSRFNVPVISHEIGQWCVFPDLASTVKYTGVLKEKNFEIFRDFLNDHHLGDQAGEFLMASGKLQALCYKEEIESALRTDGFGGFQLLDLHDFPGQGTALVGVLDPFWDSKPYVTAGEFRRFCNSTVPLARMAKRVFKQSDVFSAPIDIYHYGPSDLVDALVSWKLVYNNPDRAALRRIIQNNIPHGKILQDKIARNKISQDKIAKNDSAHNKILQTKIIDSGSFRVPRIPTGRLSRAGTIKCSLESVKTASELKLIVSVDKTGFENDWDIWVYPDHLNTDAPEEILVVDQLRGRALSWLNSGRKVLLAVNPGLVQTQVKLGFSPIFWNTLWTHNQPPHTLGILCDPAHPALAEFPTDYHTNWQWWELVSRAAVMEMDILPRLFRPIVQVVPDWHKPKRLGLVFEARAGGGKLLVCSADISNDLDKRPVARQLRYSLIKYMQSSAFKPAREISLEKLGLLFKAPSHLQLLGATVLADSFHKGYEPGLSIDNDPETLWHSNWEPADLYPHQVVIDLKKQQDISGMTYLPRQDMTNGRIADFEIYVSSDGKTWEGPAASGRWANTNSLKQVRFKRIYRARYLKLKALSEVNGRPYASAAEIGVIFQD